MRELSTFQKVKDSTKSLTLDQVKLLTIPNILKNLALTKEEKMELSGYWSGIKTLLEDDAQKEIDSAMIENFREYVRSFLIMNFPKFIVEMDFSDKTNRKVIIHLDGIKP